MTQNYAYCVLTLWFEIVDCTDLYINACQCQDVHLSQNCSIYPIPFVTYLSCDSLSITPMVIENEVLDLASGQ